MKTTTILLVALFSLTLLITPLRAGPPLICHAIDIGDAKSLPWRVKTSEQESSYDTRKLVADTLELLAPTDVPVAVRMETLRRAALYVGDDRQLADALLGRLMGRALDNEAMGKPGAMAYFDAGYLVSCYDQLGTVVDFGSELGHGAHPGAAGYMWVARAIQLAGDDIRPGMQLAAALITAGNRMPEHKDHLRAALAGGAGSKSKAERGVLEWIATIDGKTLDSLRAELGPADAKTGR